jgi:hypothetical protein
MLKKYTSNKFFSLTDHNENIEITKPDVKTKKITLCINQNISEEKNDSQTKNSIFLKEILKSNSITKNNNNENNLNNYRNKITSKNDLILQKNIKTKSKNRLKAKIKTTFSNYYTDYLFKNNINNGKTNINNFTEIIYKGDETEDLNEINMNEKTIKANRFKNSGLYNTNSSKKINFNTGSNINNNKDLSPFKKNSLIISPKRYNRTKNEKKLGNLNNSTVKIPKLRNGKISGDSKNLIYINNIYESNSLGNSDNISKSNKNMNKFKEVYKKNSKNAIKKKKTNNLNANKKQNLKKNNEKHMEKNKINKISEYEGKAKNKISTKIKIHNARKHIFLSPMLKNSSPFEKNKSSSKKFNRTNQDNTHKIKEANSSLNKEIKQILFKFNENQNKAITKNRNKINNNSPNKILNINSGTKKNIFGTKIDNEELYNIISSKNDNSSTIKTGDNNTEKDFNLENYKTSEKNTTSESKNLKDYFRLARKALKNTSHSLVETIMNNNNNFYDELQFKEKINETGQITNRENMENDDDSNGYTIKKVPIFSGINMFPQKKSRIMNDIKRTKINNNNLLYKLFFKNNDNNNTNENDKNNKSNNNIIICIIHFMDIKSLIALSSINKDFFKNLRSLFYKVIFNKIYVNKNIKIIKKLNNGLIRSVSAQYKSDIYENTSTETTYLDIIISDIDRTFPKDSKFQKNGKYYKKLYNILTKYSNYNKDIGYAQGLNFMFANALLLYDNEKDAFFYIDGMVKKFNLKKFFAEKNSKLIEEIDKFSKILEKYNPEIVNFFEKKCIYHEFFSTGWILTLFSNSMEPKNLFICWNFMNIFGWKFFYCIVIQILRFYKQIIFNTNENGLSHLMKNLLKDKKFSEDLSKILKNTFDFMKNHILL